MKNILERREKENRKMEEEKEMRENYNLISF